MLLLKAPDDLAPLADRMHGVTGFVTNLCPRHDNRPRVFSRYFHVRRVAWTADLLFRLRTDPSLNPDLVKWYCWAHDLNRWPFAHNSEKGLFDQADDLTNYFADAGITVSDYHVKQLRNIVNKECEDLNPEAEIVLLSDIITGFIEDPIWLISTINVSPEIIPSKVAEILCVPVHERETLFQFRRIAEAFQHSLKVDDFMAIFDREFCNIMKRFVAVQNLGSDGVLCSDWFQNWRYLIKGDFLRTVIFPYNNERISRGQVIKDRLILPLIEILGASASRMLTGLTDQGCFLNAVRRSVVAFEDRDLFLPNLDYMATEEPENSFYQYLISRRIEPVRYTLRSI